MIPALLLALLVLSFLFSGLEAAWVALDRVRLRHRADKGDKRARQMLAWDAVSPRADLVMVWTSRVAAAAAFVLLATTLRENGAPVWVAPVAFSVVYAFIVQLLARQVFRRLPFKVLSRSWYLVTLAGSFWSLLARPVAALVARIKTEPLSRVPAGEELLAVAATAPGISPLELSMLRSVLDFRRLTAGSLALPVGRFSRAAADRTLGDLLADRGTADARYTLVTGADDLPLGVMSCGSAALSGALNARAQSFARPLLTLPSDLPAWKALAQLRRARTPVAEVRDEETGEFAGVLTEETAVARLLGQAV
jgi:putative hemolysin